MDHFASSCSNNCCADKVLITAIFFLWQHISDIFGDASLLGHRVHHHVERRLTFTRYYKLLREASIHRRITFFLIIADFSCARLSCSYGIWLLFPMAIKEMTPATNCSNFVYLIVRIKGNLLFIRTHFLHNCGFLLCEIKQLMQNLAINLTRNLKTFKASLYS